MRQKVTILIFLFVLVIIALIFNNLNKENNMDNTFVILKTSMGDIKIELFNNEAPETVANFVKLAKEGVYDGTRFHRVIKDFMIQGGDPLSKDENQRSFWGTGGPGYVFDDEVSNVELVRGVVAMANAGPNTNGSQFFIITAEETPWLQGKHTGFGKVIEGLDILMNIEKVDTNDFDQPLEDVLLYSVEII